MSDLPSGKLLVALGVGLLFFSHSTRSSAQTTELEGTWQASPLHVSWALGDWSDSCGPRPSGGGEGGGQVEIQSQGQEFSLQGLGRSYQSSQCWEQMPGLDPRSHSASAGQIRTTCSMPSGDPRQATVITTWSPRGDTLYFDETGQYQFVIEKSNCTASVRRTRLFTRIRPVAPESEKEPEDSAPPPEPEPLPETPPAPPLASQCETLGPATKWELLPETKLLRAGESFTFQVTFRDAQGCRLPLRPEWKLLRGSELGELSPSGRLQTFPNAPSGRIELQASYGSQTLSASARIVSQKEYENLVNTQEYGSRGESLTVSEAPLPAMTVSLSDLPAEESSTPEAAGKRRWGLLLLILAGLLTGALTLYLVCRRLFAARISGSPAQTSPALSETNPQSSPAVAQGAPLVPPPPTKVCPICGQTFPAEDTFCGQDGARLVRMN